MALALAAAAVAAGAGVSAYALLGPDPQAEARLDGCGRSRTDEFTRQGPGWVYVRDRFAAAGAPSDGNRWLEGVVQAANARRDHAHPAGSDDPTTHDSYDFNINVLPDPQYADVLGGDPEARTGNFEGEGEEVGRVHIERESRYTPTFVWPERGDRIRVRGSWVWDCGHWDPGGERTEIHPYRAIWIWRNPGGPSPLSPYGEAEGDLYISTDATPAGRIAECAHRTKGDKAAFKACTFSQPDWLDVNGGYGFALRAPPKPASDARLRVRVLDMGSTHNAPKLATRRVGRDVSVSFTIDRPQGERLVVAKRVLVGWTPLPASKLPRHLRVTFERLLVRRAMDCPVAQPQCTTPETTRAGQVGKAPGEYQVYSSVAGGWRYWGRTFRAGDGQTFRVREAFDVFVAARQPWRIFVFTRECDFGSASFDRPATPMWPCPKSGEFASGDGGDDVPGIVEARFRGDAVLGLARADGKGPPTTCPAVNKRGCFQVTYRVVRIRDERPRAAKLR